MTKSMQLSTKHRWTTSGLVAIATAVLLSLFALPAHADKVDRLIDKLQKSSKYRVRLSAALNLAKLRDKRSIPVFMRALSDPEETVRGVAAAALGNIVDSSVPAARRKQVMSSLLRSSQKDKNDFVRKQAKKAYETVAAIGDEPEPSGGGGKIFIDIGAMSATADGAEDMRSLMVKTVKGTFKKKASSMSTTFKGGKPSKKDLAKGGFTGFHVDGTLTELTAIRGGGGTLVSCKVSMLLATYPEKSMFGFLKGGAKVQAGRTEKDVGFAKEDCVVAVMEDLIARKIIPTIESRAR